MITSLYADNYRCFSNFEVKPGVLTAFLGPNGSGKSASMQLLGGFRDFILGAAKARDILPPETLTRWEKRLEQAFELNVVLDSHDYLYRLAVEHTQPQTGPHTPRTCRITEESLKLDGDLLLKADLEKLTVRNDAGTGGAEFQADWQVSGLSRFHERHDNKKLIAFRDFFRKMLVLAPTPASVSAVTESQDPLPLPKPDCSDFAAYLGYLHASEPRIIREAERRLREGILEGFFSFKAEPFGDASIIRCLFEGSDGSDIIFRLDELSAGQIAAVVLHVATASVERSGGCLILDEPGNFLSVSELQPFMSLWQRLALESGRQVIMATHHPIAIDFLAGAHGLWFERSPIGPARNPVPLKVAEDATRERSYLRISDLIARGWLSGIGVETPSA